MMMKVLDKSRYTRVYQEHSRRAFDDNWRLLPKPIIENLIGTTHAPIIVFKPLCDSHLADQLLTDYPGSKAIWIYRQYTDVASSIAHKWGEHLKDVMRQITVSDKQSLNWRGERLSQKDINQVRQLYSPRMTFADAAALMWYLRNQWYFSLGLDLDPRVLLVRYESLVQAPEDGFKRILNFVDSHYEPEIIEEVTAEAIGKGKNIEIGAAVRELCDGLLGQLDLCYEATEKHARQK
jgi:hypothetical protein